MNLGHETEQVEFKKSTSELKEGVASIAAILNKHGHGELFFGVKPNGDVCGQDVAESTLRQISQAVGNSIEPRIHPVVEALDDGEGCVYVRVAFEGADRPYSCKGSYRVRVADEDVPMTAAQIESMMAERIIRKFPWDARPSDRPLSDVDEDAVREYVERGNECGRIPFPYTGVHDVLERLGLLVDGRLTNAADVLFCPSKRVRLKMGVLATHDRTEILDLQQEAGTAFGLAKQAESYILRNTRSRFVLEGAGPRREIPEIPRRAVKEALMNAFAHCDWTLGGCLQIDIFNDRIDLLSPGWFIEGQDPEDHLVGKSTSTRTRNALIAEALFRSGDIEAYGTGIPRIRKLCAESGIRVEYVREPDGTKLLFHRNDAFAGSASDKSPIGSDKSPIGSDGRSEEPRRSFSPNEAAALELVQDREIVRAAELAEKLGVTQRSASRILGRLVAAGVLVSEGSNRNRSYRAREYPS